MAARVAMLVACFVTGWSQDARASARLDVKTVALPCPESDRIPERIERLLAFEVAPRERWEILLDQSAEGALHLRLHRGELGTFDRVLPFRAEDCAGLPHVVASIVRGWLRPSWEDVAERVADIPEPGSRPGAGPAAPVLSRAANPPRGPSRWRLLLLGGGFSEVGNAHFGPSVSAAGEWDVDSRWGAALQASFDAGRQTRLGPGSIAVRVWQLAALGRFGLLATDSARLDLLAGPSVQIIEATLSGFAIPGPLRGEHPAVVAAVRWRQQLSARFEFVVALAASSRGRDELFYPRDQTEVLSISAARAAGLVGVAWSVE